MAQLRAVNLDIPLHRGDDYPWKFTVKDPDSSAHNASGSTITMTIKDRIDGTTLYTETPTDLTNGNDFTNGVFVFKIPDTSSNNINSDAVYDVQETTSTGDKITLLYGKVVLQKDVTS